jgi:hypothetical protein
MEGRGDVAQSPHGRKCRPASTGAAFRGQNHEKKILHAACEGNGRVIS